jgi:DNA-binding PadR family transcriptional regulator
MGSATGALSKLDRRGLVVRTEQRRGNRAAYVVTDAGAAALEEDA